jgi:hypothetical protein
VLLLEESVARKEIDPSVVVVICGYVGYSVVARRVEIDPFVVVICGYVGYSAVAPKIEVDSRFVLAYRQILYRYVADARDVDPVPVSRACQGVPVPVEDYVACKDADAVISV